MDLKSGNSIIGKPQMLPKSAGHESMNLLQEGGETIHPTETLSTNMDALSNTACSWTT